LYFNYYNVNPEKGVSNDLTEYELMAFAVEPAVGAEKY
jgi:hypothetical protein